MSRYLPAGPVAGLLLLVLSLASGASGWRTSIDPGPESLLGIRSAAGLPAGGVLVCLAGPFQDPVMMRLDVEGDTLWERQILERNGSSRSFESGGHIILLEDGFAVSLHSEPRATGMDTDVAVCRMDLEGDTLWTFILGLDDTENWMCTDLISCSDGGFLVTGCPGTMLPGGFCFRLDGAGELQWLTPTDIMDGYCLSAVELPEGGFLTLIHDFSGCFLLQPVSTQGEVGEPVEVRSGSGSIPESIRFIDGDLWVTLRPQGCSVRSLRFDDMLEVVDTLAVELSEGHDIRCARLTDTGLITAGLREGEPFLCLSDMDGNLEAETFLDLEDTPSGISVQGDRVIVNSGSDLISSTCLSDYLD